MSSDYAIYVLLAMPFCFFIMYQTGKNWRIIKNFMKEKHTFHDALEAFKKGDTIYRANAHMVYVKRAVIMQGKRVEQYGYTWGDDKFKDKPTFDMEDILATDWIIEKTEEK